MIPSRSDHPRVVAWLENFGLPRRDTAQLLVDALELVSETDLRRELGTTMLELLPTLAGPVAAFPAREVPPENPAHAEGRAGPYLLLEPGLPGSEAVLANILTGVLRQGGDTVGLLDGHDLHHLREHKVRTILLLDDFSGSGSQLIKFHKALRRHKTIRSWISYHLIDFHVLAYAATEKAARLLRRRFGDAKVHIVRACPTFDGAGWTPEQRSEVEALCRASAGRRNKNWALGYRDSRALIAFEHTAPNNLPYILWKVATGWNSLFEYKGVPNDLLRLFTMRPEPPHEPLVGSAGAARIGQTIDLLGRRVHDAGNIAEVLRVSIAEAERLLRLAQSLGLTNARHRLTDAGRAELKRWRAAHPVRVLPNRDEPYYPK
ncbi:phosphoribosyltransferase-like protein [Flavisphingomonas formosensis]|uniref:phosphoribosyltransferase-like protein n=1 Tax=Flavisphingomonas formosensis TaxID=861534 RepID=UPI0012FBE44E|nr:hypothetical protein [Sphingomonas formosensis]